MLVFSLFCSYACVWTGSVRQLHAFPVVAPQQKGKKKEELSSYKRQSSNLFSGGSCRPLRMLNAATETKTHGHVFGACVVQFTRG